MTMRLYGYYRSTAAYRVRIALGIKGIAAEAVAVNLVDAQQRRAEYLDKNPQGLVPALELGSGDVLSQSTAILEWLEETHPEPRLYPEDPIARARCRALCQHIACDIHPLNNLRVLKYLRGPLEQSQEDVDRWYAHWVSTGFVALERELAAADTALSMGDQPGMMEIFLIPQIYNARRFLVPLDEYPALVERDRLCQQHAAFSAAHPDSQPDSPSANG